MTDCLGNAIELDPELDVLLAHHCSLPASRRRVVTDEEPIVRLAPKVGRNDPCPCGSGRKYKKCCG